MKINTKKIIITLLLLPLWGAGGLAQTLEDYLQIAAENNAGIKADYAQFEAAMQKAPQVSSLPDPTLTMSAFGQMVETRLGPMEARFSLMQMFPWFGTLEAREDAATLMAEAKFQSYLDSRNKLFYKVSAQYFKIYELENRIQFQQENLNILQDYKELALAKVRAGSGALADVLQTELMLNETNTTLEILKMNLKPLTAQFNALLNREENLVVNVSEDLKNPLTSKGGRTGSFQEIRFKNHPKIVQMEKMIESADARETAAGKSGMPTLGIGLDYAIIGKNTVMNPQRSGQDVIMPMFSISLPIFRKKYKAAKKEAQFMQESYSYRKKQVEYTLESEYQTAVFELEKAYKMLNLYKKQMESTTNILELHLSSYENAGTSFKEVLEIRQELLEYQLAVAEAKTTYFTALAEIKYLTGKSFDHENKK